MAFFFLIFLPHSERREMNKVFFIKIANLSFILVSQLSLSCTGAIGFHTYSLQNLHSNWIFSIL